MLVTMSGTMPVPIRRLLRAGLLLFGRLVARLLFGITIEGAANAPRSPHKLLVISNHFSWFDAPLLSILLPFPPAYLIATEAQEKGWIRAFTTIFESIPIWRGQVDRKALTTAVARLQAGDVVGIFPEGGVMPELAELVASGQQIPEVRGNMARSSAQLLRAKAGVALLATMSGAQIMPVALMGSHQLMDNLKRWRRTPLTIRIGPLFGPLTLDPNRKGQARRQQMDDLADAMMCQVAALFPPEQRGYYADRVTAPSSVTVDCVWRSHRAVGVSGYDPQQLCHRRWSK
jgi:1-acyl-sn-glycerol-3-phosphate acyltransferase